MRLNVTLSLLVFSSMLLSQGRVPAGGAVANDADSSLAAMAGGSAGLFPTRPPGNPAAIGRGKISFGTNCAYCHGEDVRGGENGGTNLLRSDFTMKDKNGEMIDQFLKSDTPEHKFSFTPDQVSDIAAFIHSFRLSSRDPGRMRPPTILVGDAKAGQAYFALKCASCHSVTGDLMGIGARYPEVQTLQQTWLMPLVYGGRGPAVANKVTVTVTLADGKTFQGKMGRIDDFIVTLTEADGTARSFRRDGDKPKVDVHDPMKPHRDLLPGYSDRDIHNLTAYLETVK